MAALASAVRPADPMDRAVREMAARDDAGAAAPLRSYPLRPDRLAFIQVWPQPSSGVLLAAKGAPEAICRLCRMGDEASAVVEATVSDLASSGLRVLGVAALKRESDGGEDPGDLAFEFEGLVGFEDPVRPDVPAALAEAQRAGISVAMITGDYPATALQIAREAGIDVAPGVLSGAEISRLTDAQLIEQVRGVRVFARVSPEQKLSLVRAFQACGHLVAMTGDGINDAPALEAAQVGIAMGRRGTDVAREASDLILLDDRFASIIGGVRLGRRISTNLRKALTYIVAVHLPIAGLALLPILMGLPPMLFPMQVVVLELIIDPVCSLVFEAEPSEQTAMLRPPASADAPLFGFRDLALGLLQGGVLLAGVLGFYVLSLEAGHSEGAARGAAFASLVAANLGLAIGLASARGVGLFDRRHALFWTIALAASAITGLALYAPPVAQMFGFEAPELSELGAALALAAGLGAALGLLRRAGDLRRSRPPRELRPA
ncbi:MAG TPA: cation-translocating P-type ATPase [Phenylobacterium sp.]